MLFNLIQLYQVKQGSLCAKLNRIELFEHTYIKGVQFYIIHNPREDRTRKGWSGRESFIVALRGDYSTIQQESVRSLQL